MSWQLNGTQLSKITMASPRTPAGGSGNSQPAVSSAVHSKMPDPLQIYRAWEPKSMGVALMMFGIILFVLELALFGLIKSMVMNTGTPFYTAVLFGISGFLAIISENQPRKVLLKVCLLCSLLGAVIAAIQLIVYLVDLAKLKRHRMFCSSLQHNMNCIQRAESEKLLVIYIPVFYLLTLAGMMLCSVLSISLYHLLQTWKAAINQPVLSPARLDPEGAALMSVEGGSAPEVASQQIPAAGSQDRRRPKAGKQSVLVEKFLDAQPKVLGVVHIVLGFAVIMAAFGVLLLNIWEVVRLGFVWWFTVQCIISGVLSIVAEDRPTVNMIRACVALNIIGAIVAIINSFIYMGSAVQLAGCSHNDCEVLFKPNHPVPEEYWGKDSKVWGLMQFRERRAIIESIRE
ncbi:uncharacterized protein LOC119968060 [Scyliorhinus canicula]|uniref:uncharacterized protein LOC119968060 n=1 Tax=Scyliorhinus canicula TaxID=7830 RepID=UPI0018F74203|nr:uncharacterized protein LOC119968060 [Scyliorhinus canicula]